MKKTLLSMTALALLLSLTACSGSRNATGYDTMTRDQHYTADEAGRTNEAGDNGVVTGSNSSATNGTTRRDTTDNAARRQDGSDDTVVVEPGVSGTVQDGSSAAARGVRRAVDGMGNVVDDVAQGAADIVDDTTDAITGEDNTRREVLR